MDIHRRHHNHRKDGLQRTRRRRTMTWSREEESSCGWTYKQDQSVHGSCIKDQDKGGERHQFLVAVICRRQVNDCDDDDIIQGEDIPSARQ